MRFDNFKIDIMDTIERVDQLIKKNIIKHSCTTSSEIEIKHEHQYRRELEEYEKQRKKDALRSYDSIIKEGNKKAVQKAKEAEELKKKLNKKRNRTLQNVPKLENMNDNGENKKSKMNEQEVKKVEEAIKERAERILQEKELEKLDKHLIDQKKKTKLYELNERCRKIVKSSAKIPSENNIPAERKKILEEFEKKAMEEIDDLDEIINGIVAGKNKGEIAMKQTTFKKNFSSKKFQNNIKIEENVEDNEDKYNEFDIESHQTIEMNLDPFEHPIFTKSTDELLSLRYIPI